MEASVSLSGSLGSGKEPEKNFPQDVSRPLPPAPQEWAGTGPSCSQVTLSHIQ